MLLCLILLFNINSYQNVNILILKNTTLVREVIGQLFSYALVVSHPSGIYDISRYWLSCLGPLVYCSQTLIRLSNISILSVLDDGFSRNALCTINLISTFVLEQMLSTSNYFNSRCHYQMHYMVVKLHGGEETFDFLSRYFSSLL